MFGIIGSGFGLYGHLPVIALSGGRINLPERYREVINKRQELKGFLPQISWCKDEEEVLKRSEQVAISTWPLGQEGYIQRSLQIPSIRNLVLEKPLAVKPHTAIALLGDLKKSSKLFRINYAFMYTPWFQTILDLSRENSLQALTIKWSFMAHHFAHGLENWKSDEDQGGGAIRFFGVHFFPILSSLGFKSVISSDTVGSSPADKRRWYAGFLTGENVRAQIELDTAAPERKFEVHLTYRKKDGKTDEFCLKLTEPFAQTFSENSQDQRVKGLTRLYAELEQPARNKQLYALYEGVNKIWLLTEEVNSHKIFIKTE